MTRTVDQSKRQFSGSFRVFKQVNGLSFMNLGDEGWEFKSRQPDNKHLARTGISSFWDIEVRPTAPLRS
jgi:hypothetical protein